MNNEIDIQNSETLKKQLKDSRFISDLYQDIDLPAPSPELDQKILAAARRQHGSRGWWQKHSAWAASAVIFSFVGILSYHTWQEEQPVPPAEATRYTPAYAPSSSSIATDSDNTLKAAAQVKKPQSPRLPEADASAPASASPSGQFRARAAFKSMRSNDARQLNFDSATTVAPEALMDARQTAVAPLITPPEQMLEQINQLITSGNYKQAAAILKQLQKNYPKQPVDPVILQQLAPYQLQD